MSRSMHRVIVITTLFIISALIILFYPSIFTDTYADGLTDSQGVNLGAEPNNPDTNGDGLSDADEVNIHSTDPLNANFDGDGFSDDDEVNTLGINPTNQDTDGLEVRGLGQELDLLTLNNINNVTDGDVVNDNTELKQGGDHNQASDGGGDPPTPRPIESPVIAVIDSGIDIAHPDLAGRLVPGFDFMDDDTNPNDLIGHGTEMSGIIAANGTVRGVCPDCRIMPLKVTDLLGRAKQDLMSQAIDFAISHGADVIFIGAGSIGVQQSVIDAVSNAEDASIAVIAPAGSGGFDQTYYPAAMPTVISVVGLDKNGVFMRESNTSARETVAALGEEVLTTTLGGESRVRSGSSVAAAHVAGIVGLALLNDPKLSSSQIRQIVHFGIDPLPVDRWEETFEYGQANAQKAIARASTTFKDIAIRRLTIFPNSPLGGQTNFVRVRIVNQGNVPTGPIALRVTWNGGQVGSTIKLPSIALGIATEVDVNLPLGSPPATVPLVASIQPLPGETETANNIKSTTVTYTDSSVHDVDLDIGELSEPVIDAQTITFPIMVRNRGNQDEPSVDVRVFLDRTEIQTQTFNLPVGKQASMVGSWTIPPTQASRVKVFKIVASILDTDADPENNEWFYEFFVDFREGPALLQYADTTRENVIIDAPWKTIRDYVPILVFTPDFSNGDNRQIDSITVYNYEINEPANIGRRVVPLIFQDNLNGQDISPTGTQIITSDGILRSGIPRNGVLEPFVNFWHYIIRLPLSAIGLPANRGQQGLHFLDTEVRWSRKRNWGRSHYANTRVLRVLFDNKPFPKFDDADRYYDAHVHTIAEQSTFSALNLLGPYKEFGGPIAMLLESSYALGLVDFPLNNGNWTRFKDKVIVTDHNVFYSQENPASAPAFGPTAGTDGHQGEFDWYRTNLGRLAGEEITLKSGSNQDSMQEKIGHHLLAYDTVHFEGPWHGGDFLTFGEANRDDMLTVLGAMKAFNETGFCYAAHPNLTMYVWPPEYFDQAIGFPPHNSRTGPHVNAAGNDFLFKGSQVWNIKQDEIATENGDLTSWEFKNMNPFLATQTPRPNQRFVANPTWDFELKESRDDYFDRVIRGLRYFFSEAPNERFIRKIYMSAGTDAHGSFNYTDEIESTIIQFFGRTGKLILGRNLGGINSNAYGRVRTYTLVHDRKTNPRHIEPYESRHYDVLISQEAYRDGNTVLTDGPICKFSLDANGHFDTNTSKWHDTRNEWENADGQIGGFGDFDGGNTMLVPNPGNNVWIQSVWKSSEPRGFAPIAECRMWLLRSQGGVERFTIPAGPPDVPYNQRFPAIPSAALGDVGALVMTGSDIAKGERCMTNPIWFVPVGIEHDIVGAHIEGQGTPYTYLVIPKGKFHVRFTFGISMLNEGRRVGVNLLDADGNSSGILFPALRPVTGTGWTDRSDKGIATAIYHVANSREFRLQGDLFYPAPPIRTIMVWFPDPSDFHGNRLNTVAYKFQLRVSN